MAQQPDDSPRRGRGRPRRLSRDLIVEAAVGLVYEDPHASLTIKSVADAVGSAPMALYRYFPDRDDLLHAVADRLTKDLEVSVTELSGTTWQGRLREWMVLSMESLRPYPQLLPYIRTTRQPAWLPSFVILVKVLEPLQLSDKDQALAITLVGTTIVGQASMAAVRRPADETVAVLRAALAEADDHAADRARNGTVIDQLPRAFDRLYDTVIDSTIATIDSLSGKPPARSAAHARKSSAPMMPIFSNPEWPTGGDCENRCPIAGAR